MNYDELSSSLHSRNSFIRVKEGVWRFFFLFILTQEDLFDYGGCGRQFVQKWRHTLSRTASSPLFYVITTHIFFFFFLNEFGALGNTWICVGSRERVQELTYTILLGTFTFWGEEYGQTKNIFTKKKKNDV